MGGLASGSPLNAYKLQIRESEITFMLRVYNTLTRQKEDFQPVEPGKVGMYLCGPTVYKLAHIGHMVGPVIFDAIKRYLTYVGYAVKFVINITDVDDKLIVRAAERQTTVEKLAREMTEDYFENLKTMGVDSVDLFPYATEHIPEMLDIIRRLVERGYAYPLDGDVYFDVTKDADYGALSHRSISEVLAGTRVEANDRKRHPADFALWKSSKPGEPAWDSPWGRGRPGWHIECSAMSTKYLGQPFDIHGGGRDLIFPHHENEIAQSEGALGRPLARFWLHNGFLNINQEKMSKSLGNFFTIGEILEEFDAAALRHYFLASHYRSPMDFSKEGLSEAARATDRIYETIERLDHSTTAREQAVPDSALLDSFRQEMDDDFNTPRALALIFDEVRALNRLLDEKKTQGIENRGAALRAMCATLGLLRDGYSERKKQRFLKKGNLTTLRIEERIARRDRARLEKNWQEADRIRDELSRKG